MFRWFLGGWIAPPALMPFYAPTINSWRYQSGSWAPAGVEFDNRTAVSARSDTANPAY
jgi:hypothetical protein